MDGALAIARHDYEHAIELGPDAYFPSGMVTQAYEALGNSESTAAAYRRALASLGFAERAREWTRRALLFDPDNARLHYSLACAMATLEDADTAVALIDSLIDKVGPGALRWFQAGSIPSSLHYRSASRGGWPLRPPWRGRPSRRAPLS